MQKRVNIQVRRSDIAKRLANGENARDFIPKLTKKYNVGIEAIRKDITKVKKQVQDAHDLKIKAEADAAYQLAKETELSRLLDRKEKREILAKIARRELEVERIVFDDEGIPKKIKCKPGYNEIMKAVDLDAKMEGDYAPIKSENTHSFLDFLKETSE